MKTAKLLSLAAAIVALVAAPAFVQAQASIGLNFTGITGADVQALGENLAPPDTTGTAGPSQVAQFLNGGFAVWNKTTGQLVGQKISDVQFWKNAGIYPSTLNLTDPRIVYDPTSQRWFASQVTTESTGNWVLLGHSTTSDPTSPWQSVSFKAGSDFADFPMLGVDADGVYISVNQFSATSQNATNASIFSIPKADLLQPAPTLARMTIFPNVSFNNYGFTIQPVNDFGPSKGHGALVAVDANIFGNIVRTNINNPGAANATLSAPHSIAAMIESNPPLGRQPDGTRVLDSGGDNYNSTLYKVGSQIWAVHSTTDNGSSGIRWTVLDEATNAILQEGTISDPNFDYLYPSIAANPFGEVVIGFTRTGSGSGDFASAYAVVGATTAGVTTFGSPMLLKAGLSSYHKFNGNPERWGDYSQTSVDPTDPHAFWTAQEFALSSTDWGTQITEILVPEPGSMMVLLVMAGLALGGRRRRAA